MKFAKEMWFWITPCIIADIAWHIYSLPTKYNPWAYFFVITFPTVSGILLLASFFRDPERTPHPNHVPGKTILCPADGNLIAIEEEAGDTAIYVEMHYNNVHVTRAHLSGMVTKVIRKGGRHHWVYFFKKTVGSESQAIRKNARAIIQMRDLEGNYFEYYLICGAFFRRAKPFVKPGDQITEGQRIGVIAFGSTVRITLPGTHYEIMSQIGDKVKAGHTIICKRIL
ncbi:Phosphatidylserine decarboxylase proenzyme [Candidatus Lokiarchaeum ossiferum]|uniref:Phosphatidylserine decarboxylase proenzyme n=1 Tax=Candidatus Lokiarchaeum ossiferum TaxID=2951803 RepID=A0ABY6HRA5_9ARCH|nr:Phosphatidylserine decarboxylase proenzyme [Candidatus Lokiarchaeum sp. B-35]